MVPMMTLSLRPLHDPYLRMRHYRIPLPLPHLAPSRPLILVPRCLLRCSDGVWRREQTTTLCPRRQNCLLQPPLPLLPRPLILARR